MPEFVGASPLSEIDARDGCRFLIGGHKLLTIQYLGTQLLHSRLRLHQFRRRARVTVPDYALLSLLAGAINIAAAIWNVRQGINARRRSRRDRDSQGRESISAEAEKLISRR